MSHIESVILNSHKTQKSCYYARCLEENSIRRPMFKGIISFEEIGKYLHTHVPSNVNVEEISKLCVNFGRICSLMNSIFSSSHRKRCTINEEKIVALKV